jgi:hypothetical protein
LRQSGQVALRRSHWKMHSSWKAWAHGMALSLSSASKSLRHTAHSACSSFLILGVTSGRPWMAASATRALVGSCVVGGNRPKRTAWPVVVAEAFDVPPPPGTGPVSPAINHMGTIHIVILHWHLHPSFHMSSSNKWNGEEAVLTDRSATPPDIDRARLRLRLESDFGLRFRGGSPCLRMDSYICWATPADTAHHLLGRQIGRYRPG